MPHNDFVYNLYVFFLLYHIGSITVVSKSAKYMNYKYHCSWLSSVRNQKNRILPNIPSRYDMQASINVITHFNIIIY